ncbi:large subunit ribosomal protein L26e [Pancytospora epiphaga]|nr:large subunit ribosomal protein L26e [Pancytospora epiphaga]
MTKSITSNSRRKQRKAMFTANMAEKRMMMSSHISKELRGEYGFKAFPVHSQDVVVVKTGKYKGKEGRVLSVSRSTRKVTVEGCTMSKISGGSAFYPLDTSNLEIKQFFLDSDRIASLNRRKMIYEKTKAKHQVVAE